MSEHPPDDEPPEPMDPEAARDQERATPEQTRALVHVPGDGGFAEEPLTQAIATIGVLGAGVRGVGAMALLGANIKRLGRDLEEARKDREATLQRLESSQAQFHEKDREAAVLSERLGHARQEQRMRQVLTTIGGIIGGIAAPGFGGDNPFPALGGAILAAVLLGFGWLWKTSEGPR